MFSFLKNVKKCIGFYWNMHQSRPFFFSTTDARLERITTDLHMTRREIYQLDKNIDQAREDIIASDLKHGQTVDAVYKMTDRERTYWGDWLEKLSSDFSLQHKRISNIERAHGQFNKLTHQLFDLIDTEQALFGQELREEIYSNLKRFILHDAFYSYMEAEKKERLENFDFIKQAVLVLKNDRDDLEDHLMQKFRVRMSALESSILKHRIPPDWMKNQEDSMDRLNHHLVDNEIAIVAIEKDLNAFRDAIALGNKQQSRIPLELQSNGAFADDLLTIQEVIESIELNPGSSRKVSFHGKIFQITETPEVAPKKVIDKIPIRKRGRPRKEEDLSRNDAVPPVLNAFKEFSKIKTPKSKKVKKL